MEPDAVVAPETPEQIARVLQACTEEKIAVVPVGSGLHQHYGNPPQPPFVAVGVSGISQVEHYDPGDLTIGIGAGATLREVEALVAANGQWLPVLSYPGRCASGGATVGGMLATAQHGPLKHAFGGVRDFCIGVRFTSGDGKRGKGGGRVVKNVAGYDFMKLMIASYGTLGIITSASFKLFPRPRNTATFVCRFSNSGEAVAFRDRILGSVLAPLALEVVSPGAAAILHGEAAFERCWRILVRAGGSDRQISRYRSELGEAIASELSGEEESSAWALMDDFEFKLPPNSMLLAVSCPIAGVAEALAAGERACRERGLELACLGRAGTGTLMMAVIDPGGAREPLLGALHALRAALPPRVSAALRRCPAGMLMASSGDAASRWQVRSDELELIRTVKNSLDPAWILNRGRYFA
ncbi:MAG: FAD-binding oxidoreductase [Acidobacteria bacterium]|nr:FAD-binding oxidoreductase [Acidobacteriota bacterium]